MARLRSYEVEGPRIAIIPSTTYEVVESRTVDTLWILPYVTNRLFQTMWNG
ncbi:hypothetical protein GCM10023108_35640 [Saccharopolyspora hordei]